MFIIVPLIIIFVCSSYLYVNELSITTTISIYGFEIVTIISTIWLYKKIQNDLDMQEDNKIRKEIIILNTRLKNSKDAVLIKSTKQKILKLEKELLHNQ